MNDRDREAFEAWARGPAGYVDNQLARYADGSYMDSTTRLHWDIWQAARRATHASGETQPEGFISEPELRKLRSGVAVTVYPGTITPGAVPLFSALDADDARRYRSIRTALLSGGPEWSKLAAMLNIAPNTASGVDDAVDTTFDGIR